MGTLKRSGAGLRPVLHPLLATTIAVVLLGPTAVRGDVNVWFEVTASNGPGTGLVSVEQGSVGQPLVITTDQVTGTYQITITMMAEVPDDEALYGYSLDLISPTASNVAVTSLTYLGDFDFDLPINVAASPGKIIDDASQIVFANLQSGTLELLEFVLTIDRPPSDDVELFCGIGESNWAGLVSPIQIRYADSDPLDGEEADLVSNKPSIIIKQIIPPPPPPATGACCHADGACSLETASSCELIGGASYKGDSTDCATADCPQPAPPTGACCHVEGACSIETSASCGVIAGATYRGNGTDCQSANCPQPQPDANDQSSNLADQNADQQLPPDLTGPTPPTDDQPSPIPNHVDRNQLRARLAGLFGLPIEGNEMMSLWPVKTFGFLGINASLVLGVQDLISMPARLFLYEITFAILDANLP